MARAKTKISRPHFEAHVCQAMFIGTPPAETAKRLGTTIGQVRRIERSIIVRLGITDLPPKRDHHVFTAEDF